MKLKKSRTDKTCHTCKKDIRQGDQYGQKSKRMGESGMIAYDKTVKIWEPVYAKVPLCAGCAEKGGRA